MTFWIPPSKQQLNSNTNPFRSLTRQQMLQEQRRILEAKSPANLLKKFRNEISVYNKYQQGSGADVKKDVKNLQQLLGIIASGAVDKALKLYDGMDSSLQDIVPVELVRWMEDSLNESTSIQEDIGREVAKKVQEKGTYMGKDKKFGRLYYEFEGRLYVLTPNGSTATGLGSIDNRPNTKTIKSLVRESYNTTAMDEVGTAVPGDIETMILGGKIKVLHSAPSKLAVGSQFQVVEMPAVKSGEDRYRMIVVSDPRKKPMTILAYFGSHPSAQGAIKFGQNRGLIESVELEEASIKVGDTVHLGHGTKGGTGVIGKVVKIEGGMVHIENEKGDTFKGPMSRATLKEDVQLGEAYYATMEFMSRMAKRDPQDFIDYIKMKKMGEAEVFQKRGINFLRVRVRMPDHMKELNKVAGGFGFYAGDVVKESAEINEWWEDQVNKRSRGWKNGKVAANFQTYNAAGRTVNFKKGDDIYYHPYDMKGQSREYKLVIAAEDPRKEGTYFAVNPKHLGLKGFDNATGPANESVEINEEKFTSAQLNKLKQEYGKLKTVDPGSPTYSKLTNFLDGLSTEQLQQMVDARIPFLKGLALNRINRRKKDK